MKLNRFNLHLLEPFHVLIQEKQVSRAAHRLNTSQSSASKLLNQLRELFDDPLLIRTAKGMEATEYALKLHEEVLPLIKQIENLFALNEKFDPSTFAKVIKIGIPSTIADSILNRIDQKLRIQCPNICLDILNLDTQILQEKMSNNEIDLAITYGNQLPETYKTTRLYLDTPVCITRKHHPLMKQKSVKISDYLKQHHIVLIYDELSETLLVDRILKKHGFDSRDVRLKIRSPLAALSTLTKTDLVLTMTKSFADSFSKRFDLNYRPFAVNLAEIPVNLVWSPLLDNSVWHKWIRDQIKKIFNPSLQKN